MALKQKNIHCLSEIFQTILQLITHKKTGLNRCVYIFSVDCRTFGIRDITNIHRYLVKKTSYKLMFIFIKEMFIALSRFV